MITGGREESGRDAGVGAAGVALCGVSGASHGKLFGHKTLIHGANISMLLSGLESDYHDALPPWQKGLRNVLVVHHYALARTVCPARPSAATAVGPACGTRHRHPARREGNVCSAGHYVDIVGVTGSIPVTPTISLSKKCMKTARYGACWRHACAFQFHLISSKCLQIADNCRHNAGMKWPVQAGEYPLFISRRGADGKTDQHSHRQAGGSEGKQSVKLFDTDVGGLGVRKMASGVATIFEMRPKVPAR